MVNVGKSIGRVSIRALPDTRNFRRDLLRKLNHIERTTSIAVTVDRARVDRVRIRESIQRQIEGLNKIEADANVRVTVDKAKLKKTQLRKSIQEQFDKLGDIRVAIAARIGNEDEFQRQVRDMVRQASRNRANINANVRTAAASRQLAFAARDRVANIIPRVSKAALSRVATQLAALSGGRLAFNWLDNIVSGIARLDETLPRIALWTTGLTSLGAALLSGVAGLAGIGQGLVAMTPLLLTVPGLILNAGASLAVLVVALRDAKEQLGDLADDMRELGSIMSDGFWAGAREPIVNLVDGLMPQLRNAFREVSRGFGAFVGALADSMARELGNGRLEAIFANIAEGWDILASGTDGFAGAIVNLSQIASRYTPRLARWFVRQADAFDAWLTRISTDGRLDQWIDDAVDATYALWDATRGTAGVLRGIWRAAESAGSTGMRGFADTMLLWSETVNSPKFQRGLTSIFRGSLDAMSELADGFGRVGDLIHDQRRTIELFIRESGATLGGLIGDFADALNDPRVAIGLQNFIEGIRDGAQELGDRLPELQNAIGSILSFAGELARELGPVVGAALAAASELLDPFMSYLEDEVLPVLGPSLQGAIDELKPKLGELGEKLGPVVSMFARLAERLLPTVVDVLGTIADQLGAVLEGIGRQKSSDRDPDASPGEQMLSGFGELFTFLANIPGLLPSIEMLTEAISNPEAALERLKGIVDGDWGVMWSELAQTVVVFATTLVATGETIGTWFDEFGQRWNNFWAGNGWVTDDEVGKIEGRIKSGMGGGMTAMSGFQQQGEPLWQSFLSNLLNGASTAWENIVTSVRSGVDQAIGWIASLPGRALSALGDLGSRLFESGASLIQGFIDGIKSMVDSVASAVEQAMQAARDFFPFSPAKVGPFSGRGWTEYSGRSLMDGFARGAASRTNATRKTIESALSAAAPALAIAQTPAAQRTAAPTTSKTFAPTIQVLPRPGESIRQQVVSALQLAHAQEVLRD